MNYPYGEELIEMTRQAGGLDATPKLLETFAKLEAQNKPAVCQCCQDPENYGSKYFNTSCADCMRRLTAPRPWVGLTPEEEEEIITKAHSGAGWRFYIRETEAKLKEKNHA